MDFPRQRDHQHENRPRPMARRRKLSPAALLPLRVDADNVASCCRSSALVGQCGDLGNSVESLKISYGKPRYRVELFRKLLDRMGLIGIELEVSSA